MFRCVIALLLINTFYCSFGYPLEINETLGKTLQLLANSCQNKFLSNQIKNHIELCDITLSAEREVKENELECLIFYDINSQLCTTLRGSQLDLNVTYDSEINQPQTVDKTCTEAAKNWKFANITIYPKYYNTSQKVFKTLMKCLKACGVADIMSVDTNFFCKYYQWGSELLRQSLAEGKSTGDVVSGVSGASLMAVKTAPTMPNTTVIRSSPKVQYMNEQLHPENAQEQAQAQLEVPKLPVQSDLDNNAYEQKPINGAELSNEHLKVSKPEVNKESQLSVLATNTPNSAKNNTGQSSNNPAKDLNIKAGKEDQIADAVDENDEDIAYDSGDTLGDAQLSRAPANDDNDPSLETEPKRPKEEKKNQQKNVESFMPSLDVPGSQKDIYTNTMSDQFSEVDDHFFSFFLTATILVIFFYVLYHNKSKFRKVFLGLLVEGRQPGRRRNSRGHEYRRLDTLEQAMSTNSTAPPSKIIY